MTVVLARSRDFDEMSRVWREFFPSAGLRPARCYSAAAMGSTSNASRLPEQPRVRPALRNAGLILPIMAA